MDAVDQRLALLLQRFGGGHVGLDHHFLDQLVRIEAWRHDDAVDRAIGFEHDLALRQVEFQRLAAVAADASCIS